MGRGRGADVAQFQIRGADLPRARPRKKMFCGLRATKVTKCLQKINQVDLLEREELDAAF